MKIKHFQGYGCVNAKKLSRTVDNGTVNLTIEVRGNHECGLERNDVYDVVNWIGKRFDKSLTNYRQVQNMHMNDYYDSDSHEEVCEYTLSYTV